MRVTYTLHLLPVHQASGETPYLVIDGDTTIVSEEFVDLVGAVAGGGTRIEPIVRVLTRTAHYAKAQT